MKLIMEGWRGYLTEGANKGNVLEGIVAAAFGVVFAKGAMVAAAGEYKSQGGIITVSEVIEMISALRGGKELIEYSDTLDSGDHLKVIIGLKENEIAELKQLPEDPALQASYKKALQLSVDYVNEKRFRKFANRIAQRGYAGREAAASDTPDTIEVKAIGKAQKGKEDIQILINGEYPPFFGPGISLKGMSNQLTQAVASLSGTGDEIENFKKGLDKDVGLLKSIAPKKYDAFKAEMARLMQPLIGAAAVSVPRVAGHGRRERQVSGIYGAVSNAIAASGVARDLNDWLNKAASALETFLKAVAQGFNNNPAAFVCLVEPLIKKAVGDVELAQMGTKLCRGRMEPIAPGLHDLISSGEASFSVAPAGLGTVSLQLEGEDLLKFRFRSDAAKTKKDWKYILRLYGVTTPRLKDVISFGGSRE